MVVCLVTLEVIEHLVATPSNTHPPASKRLERLSELLANEYAMGDIVSKVRSVFTPMLGEYSNRVKNDIMTYHDLLKMCKEN